MATQSAIATEAERSRLLEAFRLNPADIDSRNRFAEANSGLIGLVIKTYFPYITLEIEDVRQEGWLGLLRATELFDHNRGIKFSSYASQCIRLEINKYLRRKTHIIHFPDHRF